MKIFSKIALAVTALGVLAYGCKKDAQDNHSVLDEQDAPVMSKLQTEIQNALSHHDSLVLYHDSLKHCTDSVVIAHCMDIMHHHDSMYHHSDSLCQIYHDQMNDIHHCDMMAECESMMNNMMGNGGMMNGGGMMSGNGSHGENGHDCSMMEYIKGYCGTMDEMEQDHEKYCLH